MTDGLTLASVILSEVEGSAVASGLYQHEIGCPMSRF